MVSLRYMEVLICEDGGVVCIYSFFIGWIRSFRIVSKILAYSYADPSNYQIRNMPLDISLDLDMSMTSYES